MESLNGKTAIILGASSAYGAAAARMLAQEGVAVVLGGRSRDKLEALEAEIQGCGGRALSLGVHLAKRHHLEYLVEAAVEAYGGLDYLLFMARAFAPPLESLDLDAFERSVDVNVKGFLYALTAALPALRETGNGQVVYLSVEEPEDADALYGVGKAAARVLLRELALPQSADTGYALGPGEIRASELSLGGSSRADATGCAEAVRRALTVPADKASRFSVHRV